MSRCLTQPQGRSSEEREKKAPVARGQESPITPAPLLPVIEVLLKQGQSPESVAR